MTNSADAVTGDQVLYRAYEARRALNAPIYAAAEVQAGLLRRLPAPCMALPPVRGWRAMAETIGALKLTHTRPHFGIESVEIDGEELEVREELVTSTAFGSLLHFCRPGGEDQPAVLVVPGLAGHFATLVRGTVRALLRDHDVYVADWHNARDAPVSAGRFGLEEYIEHLISFMEAIGPGAYLMALCQPCPAVLAAATVMAEEDNPSQPAGIVLMAGPVDARVNPGRVNRFAEKQSLAALERGFITRVPRPYAGAGRRVYPGFLQAMGFMGVDPRRHLAAFSGLARDIATGNEAEADRVMAFYAEYFAVLDVTAEFYLETARAVFKDHDLALGRFEVRGRVIDPGAIETALLTIEGAKDEMCPPGQTAAAHALCTGIPAERKAHHLQEGVGHYGVFSGSRFEQEIYPRIRSFIAAG